MANPLRSMSGLWFLSAVLFVLLNLGYVVLPPYDMPGTVLSLFLASLFVEIAYHRYMRWQPKGSKQYQLGAKEAIDTVHNEGILKYKRDGREYALYSNRVSPSKND